MQKSAPLDKESILRLAEVAEVTIPATNLESVFTHFNTATNMYNDMCTLDIKETSEPAPVFQLPGHEDLL